MHKSVTKMNSIMTQYNTSSPTIQYKITTINDSGYSCAKCSLFFREMYDDTIAVIPAIEDEELFKYLEEYILVPLSTGGYNDQSISNIQKELERYLTERNEKLKSVKYKIYITNDHGNNIDEDDYIPDDVDHLATIHNEYDDVVVLVYPSIEDPKLRSHLQDFINSKNDYESFADYVDRVSNSEASDRLERLISEHNRLIR